MLLRFGLNIGKLKRLKIVQNNTPPLRVTPLTRGEWASNQLP